MTDDSPLDGDDAALDDALASETYTVEAPEREYYTDPPTKLEGVRCCRFCQTTLDDLADEVAHHCRDTDRWRRDQVQRFDRGQTIQPGVHELGAQLLFDGRREGMGPFFAMVSQFDLCFQNTFEDENGNTVSRGDAVGRFDAIGETWQLNHDEEKVKYWTGKIATRPGDSGDAFYEYNIGLVARDDVRRKRVNFQFRPALPDAEHVDTGDPIGGLPADLPEGIRVQVDAANVPREDIVDLLQAFVQQIDVSPHYFARSRIHEWSRVYNMAYYVRVLREAAQNVVGKGELLDRLATFASHEDGRGEYKWNNAEVEGHRNAVAMDAVNLDRIMPTAPEVNVGKLLKSYYKIWPGEDDPTDPTTQPKIEVQFSSDYSEHGAVAWDAVDDFDADDLAAELDEYLVTALDWAGLPTRATDDVYVADEYWSVEENDRDVAIHPDRLHELQEQEEGLAIHHVLDADAPPAQRAVLRELAMDGGSVWYEDLAEAAGVSLSSVFRAFDTYEDVLDRANGTYQVADDVLRQKFQQLFSTIEDAADWIERGAEAIAEGTGLLSEDSAFAAWARRYGASVEERTRDLDVEIGVGQYSKYEIRKVLREGYEAARADGVQLYEKLMGTPVHYTDPDGCDQIARITRGPVHVRVAGQPIAHIG